LYELGFSGQIVNKETGELHVYSWEEVREFFDRKLNVILQESEADDYCLYLTNTRRINKMLNKDRVRKNTLQKEFVPNFREEKAVQKIYKDNRKQEKPKHFYNVLAHIMGNHPHYVDEDGLEADDALCVAQIKCAKECGVKVPFHGGHYFLDYEDWVKYAGTTFIRDNKGYLVSDTGKGETRKVWSLHRDIMGNPEGFVVDHVNGNKLDNRKYNLRVCTVAENVRNSVSTTGSSKYKGVSWDSSRNKWVAQIKFEREQYFLGRFDSEESAAKAYDDAAKDRFGEFARLNFQEPFFKPHKETIICSRDKDVRQCPLWHYSWEINKQPSIGPLFIEPMGFLEKKDKTATGKPKPVTLFGGGHKFFYAQLLMGDNTDNIGGLQGYGPVFAYNLLNEATTERQLYELVAEMYVKNCGDDWKTLLKEQADLLYMVREYKEDGTPKLWFPPRRDE
jgi:hypothetical protein